MDGERRVASARPSFHQHHLSGMGSDGVTLGWPREPRVGVIKRRNHPPIRSDLAQTERKHPIQAPQERDSNSVSRPLVRTPQWVWVSELRDLNQDDRAIEEMVNRRLCHSCVTLRLTTNSGRTQSLTTCVVDNGKRFTRETESDTDQFNPYKWKLINTQRCMSVDENRHDQISKLLKSPPSKQINPINTTTRVWDNKAEISIAWKIKPATF